MTSRRGLAVALVAAAISLAGLDCGDSPTDTTDRTAPNAVSDLRVTSAGTNSLVLRWTAPGDDGGSGRANRYDLRYSTRALTAANFDSATALPGVPAPATAGSSQELVTNGLLESTTYWFALRTADEVPNWSALSNVVAHATTDGTAPGAVLDLAATGSSDSSVALAWTAPGDDGSVGTAIAYTLRFAVTPITDSNWTDATPVPSPPAPAPGGTAQQFTVNGLAPGTAYYFVIRALDDAGNLASLSNLLRAMTSSNARGQDALVRTLRAVYATRDIAGYSGLFSHSEDGAPFSYIFPDSLPNGEVSWDRTEELRIQRRMFDPQHLLPGETPVPAELWLLSIDVALTRTSPAWTERPDLYRSDSNPSGLDPGRWKATTAEYHAELFFDTQGATDYRVDGRAAFVVIDDLSKFSGETGKFLLYRWEDLGVFVLDAVESATWTSMKDLYR